MYLFCLTDCDIDDYIRRSRHWYVETLEQKGQSENVGVSGPAMF